MKKTLVIDPKSGGDFSLDLLFSGLLRRNGVANVIDFPAHEKHRRNVIRLTGDDERDYGIERSSLSFAPGCEDTQRLSADEIFKLLVAGEIERIFVDERDESYGLYVALKACFFKVPVIVVAGHDRFWNDSPQKVARMYGSNLEAIFVDDWQPEYDSIPYVKLTNLSANFDHLWNFSRREQLIANKKYDICFMGYNSSPSRDRFIGHILKKFGHLNNHIILEKRPDTFSDFVRHDDYFSKMAESRVCINLRGASVGGRALRYYEIPYVGSYMLSQRFDARLVRPFRDGLECGYFSDELELEVGIERALLDPFWRECIALAGRQHLERFHTARTRVDYIYEELARRS